MQTAANEYKHLQQEFISITAASSSVGLVSGHAHQTPNMTPSSWFLAIASCLLFLSIHQTRAMKCVSGTEGGCVAENSCEVGGELYCCASADRVVHMVSMNDEVVNCDCDQMSGANTGYRCTTRSGNFASVTSASWLTCVLTVFVAVLAF